MNHNHLNMWSNVGNYWGFPCTEPFYVDLSIGNAYSFIIANTTNADIDTGVLELWGADADPADWCMPGPFSPLDPVAGCTAIVSGVDEPGPVTITLSAHMPIKARSICKFSAPCPAQFFQLRGVPAGAQAWAVVSSLKRTDWSHAGPWGFIPAPMDVGIESMMARSAPAQQLGAPRQLPGQAAAPQQQPQPPQPQQQPQPQAQRERRTRPQPQPAG